MTGEAGPELLAGEFLSLQAMRGTMNLPRDAYYPRILLMLLDALEEACAEACARALPDQGPMDIRQQLALSGTGEAQRAMMLSSLLARHVTDLEACLLWFALLLEAGCALAQRMEENPVRRAVHFLLPEYLDALYRLSNLYFLQTGQCAQDLLGQYPEIMPGRPLPACIRPPRDGVCGPWQEAGLWDEMALLTLAAAARQARDACIRAGHGVGDGLPLETALLCRQHETLLSSLLPQRAPLDRLRRTQYMTAFLYDSCGQDETLPGPVRALAMGEEQFALLRLQRTEEWLRRLSANVRTLPGFPAPLLLRPCKGYVRDALQGVGDAMLGDRSVSAQGAVSPESRRYRQILCPDEAALPSRQVIRQVIARTGSDYRFEIARHPIGSFRDRAQEPGNNIVC